MPINPSALGDSGPEEQKPEETAKRTRRSKAQMIADAVVPANDEQVDLKDSGTGAKIQRPWLVALEMVRDGKAEFVDKAMKYAVLKHDQQKVAGAFEPKDDEPGSEDQSSSIDQTTLNHRLPPEAEVGDEVRIGKDVFRVGHGGVLTSGPVARDDGEIVHPKRTWQRELGTGGNGPWEVVHVHPSAESPKAETNGKGAAELVKIPDGVEIEQISVRGWRIGTGVLEKIGLPDYSSLQIGPITASREVVDDGRRTTVEIGGREASIPTVTVEVARQACDIVEYIARYQRGELVSFLESTGALKQPVS